MHDPLSVADLVHDELHRQASGYDVSEIEADLGLGTIDDHAHLEARYQELIKTQLRPLSYRRNGIYAVMWATALVSAACVASTVTEAVERSLDYVPPRSRLAEALGLVIELYRSGHTWEQALERIRSRFGHYSWVHSINNACLITAGLLWGSGDFAATVGLTVQGGWDTDSNAATAGSVIGTVLGAARLPAHFISPLQDRTRSAVFGYDNSRISDLASRTTKLAEYGLPSDPVHVSGAA